MLKRIIRELIREATRKRPPHRGHGGDNRGRRHGHPGQAGYRGRPGPSRHGGYGRRGRSGKDQLVRTIERFVRDYSRRRRR